MSAPNIINIEVNQKASFELKFNVKENGSVANLQNYTTSAKFKPDVNSPDSQAISFASAVSNTATGEVTISLTSTQTTALVSNQRYVYDVAITNSSGFKTRIVQGYMKASPGVA